MVKKAKTKSNVFYYDRPASKADEADELPHLGIEDIQNVLDAPDEDD